MENSVSSIFGTLALIISDIVMLDAAVTIVSSRNGSETFSIGVAPWIIMAAASLILFQVFLRHERTLPQAAAFLAASYAAMIALLLIFFVRPPSFISAVIAVLFWAVPYLHIFRAIRAPTTPEKLISSLEGVIVVLLFLLIFIIALEKPFAYALPCIMSMFLCLASLIIMRTAKSGTNTGGRIRGAAVMLAFLLLTGAVIATFLLFVSASFGDTVAVGAAALLIGIKYFLGLLLRIFGWIASLFPTPEHGGDLTQEMPPMPGAPGEAEEIAGDGQTVLLVIICAVAVLVAALVIVGVVLMRRNTLGGRRKFKTPAAIRRRPRSRPRCFRRFFKALQFFAFSILYRNTPQGAFTKLERWGRIRGCGRGCGETQRSYLLRLSAYVPEYEAILLGLADALDARWYGDPAISQLSRREIVKLRRSFSYQFGPAGKRRVTCSPKRRKDTANFLSGANNT